MSNETRRILLVEDEKAIRDAVTAYLERENYWVTAVGDGQDALEEFQKHHFDLVILDLMLPRVPGERVCRVIRDTSDVPIIMLTAKGEVEDRIIGLELGADDYLVKPFSPRELVARSRALLRRVHADSEPQREVLEFGELTIDVSGHKVLVSGEEIDLTASEFKLLTTLSRYPGRVYSRMELVEKVLGYDFEGYERTIDSHVKNLRAKIGDNPRQPEVAPHRAWRGLPLRGSHQERPVAAPFASLPSGPFGSGVPRPLRRSSMTETEAKPRILETAEEVAPPAASSPSPERKKEKKHLRWSNLSYTTRVTLAFALIAAMTALVAIGVVSFVWEQHFRTYTADNMQTLCETTANRIAAIYEETGDLWNPETTRPAAQATELTSGVGVRVIDLKGAPFSTHPSSSTSSRAMCSSPSRRRTPRRWPRPILRLMVRRWAPCACGSTAPRPLCVSPIRSSATIHTRPCSSPVAWPLCLRPASAFSSRATWCRRSTAL